MTLAEVLAFQVQANALNKKTTASEFARQLLRISKLHPELSFGDLARISGKNPRWVKLHFALCDLHPLVEAAVDRGEICATPAHYLAKFEPKQQLELLPFAKTMTVEDFIRLASERLRQARNKDTFTRERARVAEGFILWLFPPAPLQWKGERIRHGDIATLAISGKVSLKI
jgi:hypothetical protein